MEIAKVVSKKSKDRNTKVGCVLEKEGRILSIGYNGAPRKFPDDIVPMGHSENLIEDKNTFMVHAELNAILNYGGSLRDLKDSTLYVTVSPCYECAKAIAQLGISRIVYLNKYKPEIFDASLYILKMCGIHIEQYIEEL